MSASLRFVASACVLAAVGCSGSGSGSATDTSSNVQIAQSPVSRVPASTVAGSALSAAVAANNAFALDLYTHVLAKGATGNVLTSPISASLALTMTYAGAKGDTASEMAAALHLDPTQQSSIFAGQNALSQALNGRAASAFQQATARATGDASPSASDFQLDVVNSVWGEASYTWEQPFLDILAANYGTGVYRTDFEHASESARLSINDWVSTHTNDKIEDLLPSGSVTGDTRMVLVNALHLKLPWANPFQSDLTSPATFTRADSTTVSTPFMHLTDTFRYQDDGQAQITWLALAGTDESVVIALPHAGTRLAEYEAGLSAQATPFSAPASGALVALSLPKTSFTSDSFSLSDALKDMGMKKAFDANQADFSGLCAHPADGDQLSIADVLQKAMISMQETGVEAAAATAVIVLGSAAIAEPAPEPLEMTVNRPYLVAIVDDPTGAVLMLGHIQDPSGGDSQ